MATRNYQYETSPRKLEPDVKTKKQKNTKKGNLKVVKTIQRQEIKVSKEQRKRQVKLTLVVLLLFVVLLAISYQNSQINESFNQMQNQKKELAALQKENEQLEVNIQNSLNMGYIEQQAKEKLGMQKLTNKQTVYVTLPKKDYTESASEKIVIEDNQNWFENIMNKILDYFKNE